jgi:hypothetical protein
MWMKYCGNCLLDKRNPYRAYSLRMSASPVLDPGLRPQQASDGYAGYKTIANAASDEAITLAFCWAHLPRGPAS